MTTLAFPLQIPVQTPAGLRVRQPVWRVAIEGRDVTREISPMILSVTYTDHTQGESDTLDLQIEDSSGRWRGGWHPSEGDRIEVHIGYEGEQLLPCGAFAVDETEASGPPDVLTIRAIAAGPVPAFRTRRSAAFEGQTLEDIARAIAARHGLRLTGAAAAVAVGRVTQDRESDLAFLARLAERFGYVFSVRDDQLILIEVASMEDAAAIVVLQRAAALEYKLKRKTHRVYKACEIAYHDAAAGATIRHTVDAPGVIAGDTYRMRDRVESRSQAERVALATLRRMNTRGVGGSVQVAGDPRLVSGSRAELRDFGIYDGMYQVAMSSHRVTRTGGYDTTLGIKVVES